MPHPGLLAALGLLAWQAFAALPGLAAQPGDSATTAVAIAANGRFAGTVPPQSSSWFRLAYLGSDQTATITLEYLPGDSSRVGLVVYKGGPQALRALDGTVDRVNNQLTWQFNEPKRRDLFVQVINDHRDRYISFVGRITPTGTFEGPPRGTSVPTPGPVADTPNLGIDVQPDGSFIGVVAPRQVVWYRFYYGSGGNTSTLSAEFVSSSGNARLDLYTGPDAGHLTQRADMGTETPTTLTQQIVLPDAQWVYFTLSNNSSSAQLAYVGQLTPVYTPPVVQPTAIPALPTPTPVPTPRPIPGVSHDQRYFPETRFRIDDDAIWGYFESRGQLETFGFPVSRTFMFLGCRVQIFQRQVIQLCAGQAPTLINLLDPDIFPYSRVNGSIFPDVDESLKAATPRVDQPDYGTAILEFMSANAPAGLDLELWGAPISRPRPDPTNADFIYQRFQRGIFHRIVSQGAWRGILLADYLKAILLDREVPTDLRQQAQGSKFLAQYCPSAPNWLCRPSELDGTDLTFAFEPG